MLYATRAREREGGRERGTYLYVLDTWNAPLLERQFLLLASLEEERLLTARNRLALFLPGVANGGPRPIALRTLGPDRTNIKKKKSGIE